MFVIVTSLSNREQQIPDVGTAIDIFVNHCETLKLKPQVEWIVPFLESDQMYRVSNETDFAEIHVQEL